jgi:hypothetical protein
MKKLQDRLLKQQAAFVRRVRRVFLVAAVAVVCLLAFVLHGLRRGAGASEWTGPELEESAPGVQAVAPEEGEEPPSQLVPSGWLQERAPDTVVRRTGERALKTSVIDPNVIIVLLQTVAEQSQEGLRTLADRELGWEDFVDPQSRNAVRGRVCSFRGTLCRWMENLQLDLSGTGLEKLYEGQILDGDGRFYSFYCFEGPPGQVDESDIAELTGIFYGLIKYPTRGGEELVTPLIVARGLTFQRRPSAPGPLTGRLLTQLPHWARWATVGAVALIVCLVGSLLMRRRPAELRLRRGRATRAPEADASSGEEGMIGPP